MMKPFLSIVFSKIVQYKNNLWINNAVFYQEKTLKYLIRKSKKTTFGKDHNFSKIKTYKDWKKNVPIRDYEGISKYVDAMKAGEKDVLWPGKPVYFCKTSGTTSGSKYIPISKESMPYHIKSARDAILSYISETHNSSIVQGKMIFLQGSPKLNHVGGVLTGRLSGIVAHHIPSYLKKNRLPSYKTNCIEDWEEKLDSIVDETINEKMSLISGIPPWVQMYFEKIKAQTNKKIGDVFPYFKLFIYGGVNFSPYKKTFERLIGRSVDGVELYPASEGFIAYQNSQKEKGMLLCVNHGIFYEFIRADEFFNNGAERIMLKDVQLGVNYVIVLNTNAGLFGYNIGDTIKFVNTKPYKIIVSGRIKHFTSAFGEHVIAEEVEKALKKTVRSIDCEINEFHVSPQVSPKHGLAYHEWFIEFQKDPKELSLFIDLLDENLQSLNSYYKDLISGNVLTKLKVTKVLPGGFKKYMKSVGKLGGQNKPPRLSNDRKTADNLEKFKI